MIHIVSIKSNIVKLNPHNVKFSIKSSFMYLYFRDHPFSTYAKFSEKLTFLTPDTHNWLVSIWNATLGWNGLTAKQIPTQSHQ